MDSILIEEVSREHYNIKEKETKFINNDNLDVYNKEFLENIYDFHQTGGFIPLCWREILKITIVTVYFIFLLLVIFMFDWKTLIACKKDCGNISQYIEIVYSSKSVFWITLSCVIVITLIIQSVSTITKMYKIKKFCEKKIDHSISIGNLNWEEFTKRLNLSLSSQKIASWIMQYDNFMIALINNNHLQTTILGFPVFNTLLEKIFKFCIFGSKDSITWQSEKNINKNYRIIGVIYCMLMPFILPVMILYYLSKNMHDMYVLNDVLGSRSYPYEKYWYLREYNELEHFLKRRLNKSKIYAEDYFSKFRNNTFDRIGYTFQLISGLILLFIVFISAFDDSLLTDLSIYDRNMIWHIAFWTYVSTLSKKFLIINNDEVKLADILLKWSEYSHYLPDDWYEIPSSNHCRKQFSRFLPTKIFKIIYDIMGCVTAPYFLLVAWPSNSYKIVNFIQHNFEYDSQIGHICSLSKLDLEQYGSLNYGPYNGVHNHYSKQGKIEKSLITFAMNYKKSESNVENIFPTTLDSEGKVNMKKYIDNLINKASLYGV